MGLSSIALFDRYVWLAVFLPSFNLSASNLTMNDGLLQMKIFHNVKLDLAEFMKNLIKLSFELVVVLD